MAAFDRRAFAHPSRFGYLIVERRRLPPPAAVQVYALTRWGLESEPIFQALGRWAVRSPAHDPSLPLSPSSLMLSLRTMFDPSQSQGVRMTVRFVVGGEAFVARVAQGALVAAREPSGGGAGAEVGDGYDRSDRSRPAYVGDPVDLVFTGTTQAVAAAIHGKVPLSILEEAGDLAVAGERAKAERFVSLFAFPPAAGSA